jgi:hypothetical protein
VTILICTSISGPGFVRYRGFEQTLRQINLRRNYNAIQNHHARASVNAGGSLIGQITLPGNFAPQSTDVALSLDLDEYLQRFFDYRAFGGQAAGPHGRSHQLLVNDDVSPHDRLHKSEVQNITHDDCPSIHHLWLVATVNAMLDAAGKVTSLSPNGLGSLVTPTLTTAYKFNAKRPMSGGQVQAGVGSRPVF